MEKPNEVSQSKLFLSIALLSCAVVIYEIAMTRILSVVLWYHWAFLCISLAMMGLGVPGVWFSLVKRPTIFLSRLVFFSAILIPASIVLIVKFGNGFGAYSIFFVMGCILLPLLCLGGAICLLLIMAPGKSIGRMYGFDLLGAFGGALLVIPLLHLIPTPQLIGAISLLSMLAYVLVKKHANQSGKLIIVLLGALIALFVWRDPFALQFSKAYVETGDRKPIHERWTPTARLTFFDNLFFSRDKESGFFWGKGQKAPHHNIKQYWIEQDGYAGTPIIQFSGKLEDVSFLLDDVTTIAYQIRPPKSVAIIGAGGGRDILSSLLAGAKHVDAVELNGYIVSELSTRFKEFSGDVYHLPNVHAIVDEGRSFLTRSKRPYDVIQISLIDSWSSTAAGAYALSENNLYTIEAYQLYFNRLARNGIITTSRWTFLELPRLILLAKKALAREGIANPNSHLAVVVAGSIGNLLLSKQPFSNEDVDNLGRVCRIRGFVPHYPVMTGSPKQSFLADVINKGREVIHDKKVSIHSSVDDKPFFFQMVSPFQKLGKNAVYGKSGDAVQSLQLLMVGMSILTVLLFFLPFALYRWLKRHPGFWRGSSFYAFIGIAFMFIEIPWLQRFILFLGHPSYAATVVLACILLGAALGSMASVRIGLRGLQKFGLLLPILLITINTLLPSIFSAALGLHITLRVVLSGLVLLPISFLMGFFFPLGMLRFGDGNKAWFWAMNGAAGVLSSVFSLALSIEFGFAAVSYVGTVCYFIAWTLVLGRSLSVE